MQRNKYFSPSYLFPILTDIDIDKELIIDNISSFRLWGSHIHTIIPRTINLDEDTFYCLGLYAAEGDTGFNGKSIPSKLRITNTLLNIITFFRDQLILNKFNQENNSLQYYLYFPFNHPIDYIYWQETLQTSRDKIHAYYDHNVRIPKIRLSCEKKIILLLTLELITMAKIIGKEVASLGYSYVQGLFDGEGTAYCKKMKYVRIEMKNTTEMQFVYEVLTKLGIETSLIERRTRIGMYILRISRYRNIITFNKNIGFKLNSDRNKIVTQILHYYADNPHLMH